MTKRVSAGLAAVLAVGLVAVLAVGLVAAVAIGALKRSVTASHGLCPRALSPSLRAPEKVVRAARRYAERNFTERGQRRYEITTVVTLERRSFTPGGVEVYRRIAARRCGSRVADRSSLVLVRFPDLEAVGESVSQAVLYLARTGSGWEVWWRFR